MRLTKERKAYFAVFGLGLVVLAADRLWFTPAGANAASAPVEPEAAAPSPAPAPEAAVEAPASPSFGERLRDRASWQTGPARDAFVPPAEWTGAVTPETSDPAAPAQADFARSHRLSAVYQIKDGEGKVAVILDGHLVKQGEEVEGYRLVGTEDSKEGRRAALFERDGITIRLVVPERGDARKPDKSPR